MTETTHFYQWLSLFVAVFAIVFFVGWGIVTRRNWFFVITIVSWLIHVVIFYSVVIMRFDSGITALSPVMTNWSAVIRLQAVIMAAACGLILLIFAYFDRLENSWIHRHLL